MPAPNLSHHPCADVERVFYAGRTPTCSSPALCFTQSDIDGPWIVTGFLHYECACLLMVLRVYFLSVARL